MDTTTDAMDITGTEYIVVLNHVEETLLRHLTNNQHLTLMKALKPFEANESVNYANRGLDPFVRLVILQMADLNKDGRYQIRSG
jgi:hypothetical protein